MTSGVRHTHGNGGEAADHQPQWMKLIDQSTCIGCHACTTACKSENEVPLGVTRTYVKSVDVGTFPQARRNFQVTRCNQCADAPCVTACPTSAMFKRDDGIVDFDKEVCIGCKACMAACPYDAIFINPEDGSAEKCNFCAHRVDMGLEPACAVVCPVGAIIVGDVNDPTSRLSDLVNRGAVSVRRPEKDTRPTLFYKGADQSTLDPLGAAQPPGDIMAWAQQPLEDGHTVRSGAREGHNSSAAAVLSYDIGHDVPWDWRVGAYTWTKGVGAGAYLVGALLQLLGVAGSGDPLWLWAVPLIGLLGMAATGGLLIGDLEHPARFFYIFTRPQWRSWLVRGGLIIMGYSAVLTAHLLAALLGADGVAQGLMIPGIPLAVLAAVYTAFLFAQAKARDLWQNPLLPPHFVVQAMLAGGAALVVTSVAIAGGALVPLAVTTAVAAGAHLLFVAGEVTLPHGTNHAAAAVGELVRGRMAGFFWSGAALVAVALATPWLPVVGAVAGLVGLLAYEHAYVRAGQLVPLA